MEQQLATDQDDEVWRLHGLEVGHVLISWDDLETGPDLFVVVSVAQYAVCIRRCDGIVIDEGNDTGLVIPNSDSPFGEIIECIADDDGRIRSDRRQIAAVWNGLPLRFDL